MALTYDLNVQTFTPLLSPESLKEELPLTDKAKKTVIDGRRDIERILKGCDDRLLVIVGPCSIHDEESAMEYAEKLKALSMKVNSTLCIVMRVYFEKPRTTVGWKGLINDPLLDSTCNIDHGLKKARKLLININHMGLPAATEMLDPIIPQYISGLISWCAIGARTTESQTHREMASGLSMPVGFKNSTDGSLSSAVNALEACRSVQHFLGIDPAGKSSIVKTSGNKFGHIVLRGGIHPNYDPLSIEKTLDNLREKNLFEAVIVDCSHDNSGQNHEGQAHVFRTVLDQRIQGNNGIKGVMLESHLFEGNQQCSNNIEKLKYGVSITDKCISWQKSEELLLTAHEKLKSG